MDDLEGFFPTQMLLGHIRAWFNSYGGGRLVVGPDDFRGLFQPK